MGIYDRDYYRGESLGFSLTRPRSAVVGLILVNVAIFIAESLFATPARNGVVDWLAASVQTLTNPLYWWQFVTYGFVHDPSTLAHLLFNMVGLWFLGRDIEETYGPKEFLRIYFAMIVLGGIVWAAVNRVTFGPEVNARVMGASGAVTGIVVLYALNFPRRMILFMFILPMPAWVFGILIVLMDVMGASGWKGDGNVAYSVHLAGAAFAFIYFQQGWNFGRLFGSHAWWTKLRARPHLRLHDPDTDPDEAEDGVPEEEVDRILEKISREGESSLTRKERRILVTASREYQRRRNPD